MGDTDSVVFSELTTSERRTYVVVGALIAAFLFAAARGYGLLALWIAFTIIPIMFLTALAVILLRRRN